MFIFHVQVIFKMILQSVWLHFLCCGRTLILCHSESFLNSLYGTTI
jgi:hypothetical protein